MNLRYFFPPLQLFLLIALIAFPGQALFAAPRADLWERWTASNEASTESIDHSAWNAFLGAYVQRSPDGVNRIRYAGVDPADRKKLSDYLARLETTPISGYSREEQRAYWINFYNALTVQVILEHYPVKSIRDIDISPGFFSNGPWDKKLVTVEGAKLSLNDIEHRILRPIWKDPRIHYAVNCASIGCPNLMTVAFTAANTESLLEQGAREYINHSRGVEIVDGKVVASKIYDWFMADFGDTDQEVIAHLKRYAEPELKARLRDVSRVDDHRYDWSLNDTSK